MQNSVHAVLYLRWTSKGVTTMYASWSLRVIAAIAFSVSLPYEGSAETQRRILLVQGACSYLGEQLPRTVIEQPGHADIVGMIQTIVSASGLAVNFETIAAPIPNAAALILNGKRIVLYNPVFLETLGRHTKNRWLAMSILAHEIGHHLNGHTIGNKPTNPGLEIEADYFSGFVLQRLGAELDEATMALRTIGSHQGSITHPPQQERLASIARGWRAACAKDPDCAISDPGALEQARKADELDRAYPDELGKQRPDLH